VERRRIEVTGTCQGVGFRPFVYRLAERFDLAGWVRNDSAGVTIEVEGPSAEIEGFVRALREDAPPLAEVEGIRAELRPAVGAQRFRIEASRSRAGERTRVAPDTAPCDACLAELRAPADRRHGYPFLNCTHCGPRFTIVRSLPYDRTRTTMAAFALCDPCRAEYDDPRDRRFHAQPTACPRCGPRLSFAPLGELHRRAGEGRRGSRREGRGEGGSAAEEEEEDGELRSRGALAAAAEALRAGAVVAVKGLGGFHLACDARSPRALRTLRERKGRPAKPFALMVRDVEEARTLCRIDPREEEALRSPRRPIVLLERREGPEGAAEAVAPGLDRLGIFLPYTPLHELLLEAVGRPLVLTSGNRSGEPIAYRDEEARERLTSLCDALLTHDRPIHAPCDDSVVRVVAGGLQVVRRSRGWVPEPTKLDPPTPVPLLAVGGHQKNTFCLAQGDRAFLSQHVGELEHWEVLRALREGIGHFSGLFGVEPEAVAHDLHPEYASTKLGRDLAREAGLQAVPIQHHHAHVASCLAEHGEVGPVIGVAFDGTGYGNDGAIWGGEFLVADLRSFTRRGHLAYRSLPGGEAAVRAPWRMALAHLEEAAPRAADELARRWRSELGAGRIRPVRQMIRGGVASPLTSSVGRLFDAAAAVAGLRLEASYEAQAAVELEGVADRGEEGSYPAVLVEGGAGEPWRWDPGPLLEAMIRDGAAGASRGRLAARFHHGVRDAVRAGCRRIRDETGITTVALTGGVFQNAFLTEATVTALEAGGFRVLLHRSVPPNDGGLSLGQAAVAAAALRDGGPGAETELERRGRPHRSGVAATGEGPWRGNREAPVPDRERRIGAPVGREGRV